MAGVSKGKKYDIRYTAAALIIAAIAFVYWSAFCVNAFNDFHFFGGDLSLSAYNLYFYIHYGSVVHGLQWLAYFDHVSPDTPLLIMPFYAVWQSPLSLLFLQVAVMSLTVVAVFFITRSLTGNQAVALMFAIAFLFSPSMYGVILFDFHVEMLIPLFMLLTFYAYMKLDKKLFYVSLALLIGIFEVMVPIVLVFGLGLLAYERLYDADKKARGERTTLALIIIAVAVIAGAFYGYVSTSLNHAYASGQYPGLPTKLDVTYGPQNSLLKNTELFFSNIPQSLSMEAKTFAPYDPYLVFAALAIFLGLGLAVLPDLLVLVLFSLAFFAGVIVNGNITLTLPWLYHYTYAVPGTIIAAILGVIMLQRGRGTLAHMFALYGGTLNRSIIGTCIIAVVALFALMLLMFASPYEHNPYQSFLFQNTPQQQAIIAQVYSMLALIPPNASVVAMYPLQPQLSERYYIGNIQQGPLGFTPQYILVDFNENISTNAPLWYAIFEHYITNNPYTLYARNGTAELYKRE